MTLATSARATIGGSMRGRLRRSGGRISVGLALAGCGHIELGSIEVEADGSIEGETSSASPSPLRPFISGVLPRPPFGDLPPAETPEPIPTGNAAPTPTGNAVPIRSSNAAPIATGDTPPATTGGAAPIATDTPPITEKSSTDLTLDGGSGPGASNAAQGELTADAGFDAGTLPPARDLTPPSCRGASESCGPSSDSCCLALPVEGSTVALPIDSGGTLATVTISSYYLDKYEVTVDRFRAFLAGYDAWRALGNPSEGAGGHPHAPGSGWQKSDDAALPASSADFTTLVRKCGEIPQSTLDLPNSSGRIPVNCVSWIEAAAFCAWDGGRLPTFPEWYAAAAGGALGRIYPWGNEPTPSRAYASYGCALGLERPECTAAYVLPVGSHPFGAGYYGQHDLAGSMAEWVMGGSLEEFALGCTDCVGLTTSPIRFWKGGSWIDSTWPLANASIVGGDRSLRLQFIGTRCARDAL